MLGLRAVGTLLFTWIQNNLQKKVVMMMMMKLKKILVMMMIIMIMMIGLIVPIKTKSQCRFPNHK